MALLNKLFAILCLLLLSGFFSSSEVAFFSLSKTKLKRRKLKKSPGFKYVYFLLKDPVKFLTTVLIGNELVNISISVLTAAIVYSILNPYIGSTSLSLCSIIITVPALLLFGEIIPKTIAVQFPENVARINSFVLYLFSILITPIQYVLNNTAKIFVTLFVRDPSLHEMSTADIDEDTFKSMVDMGSRHGNIEPSERDLIHRVFRLDDIEISRIMTPEDKIIKLADSCTENKFLDIIKNEKHSRYPVYSKTVDNIIGFIHAKDLLRIQPKNPDFSIRSLIRKPALVYADNNALSVFLLLKKNKIHIAVVKDRNEKTAGIITMEDILEELFGEIMDETDMVDENGT